MSQELDLLNVRRRELNNILDVWDPNWVNANWPKFKQLLDHWWGTYKRWEAQDTFNAAFQDGRMTVRTFAGDSWEKQVSKEFKRGDIKLASYEKKLKQTVVRIFADSKYTPLDLDSQREHDQVFHKTDESLKYHAKRGIDSSAFANPASFASRETKYAAGLHDLSASLLNPKLSIFDQIHNNDAGAHFSFLPLSMEEDQEMLYNLTGFAKALKTTFNPLYTVVRGYRAAMTRVKLAQEFDMAIVYSAVPVANPGNGPKYKLRYGLGKLTTVTGEGGHGQQSVTVTAERYEARRAAARKFKSILGIRDEKNEIVISIRQHAGQFPVYAIRKGNELQCYNIVDGTTQLDGNTISADGHLTHDYMIQTMERGTAGLPVREPASILAYGPAPVDSTFRNRLEQALDGLEEIPKRSGMRVFVIGPRYDQFFQGVLAVVKNHVLDLNKKGYRLSVASLPNRAELPKAEVRLYCV